MSSYALDHDALSAPQLVAPPWHTALLVSMFVAIAVAGALFQHGADATQRSGSAAPLYVSLIVMEWALVLFVWKAGLRRSGTTLRSLVGGRWSRPRDVAVDLVLALAVWGVWKGFLLAWDRWIGPENDSAVAAMLPRSPVEIVLWIALAVSAGFAEELVFRGYLQTQFHALTRRRGLALVLQAMLFAISHGYQGVQACLRIVFYGVMMGVLALVRGSLRPGIAAHAWTDIAVGLLKI